MLNSTRRHNLSRRSLLAVGAVAPATAMAQAWPTRPLVLLGGGGPGGATYAIAITIAEQIRAVLGQPVVLENRPGPAAFAAALGTLNQPADGYTIFMTSAASHGIAPSLFRRLPFDMATAFVAVSRICLIPNLLYVAAGSPIRTLRDLVEQAKARPGALDIGSLGSGTTTHLAGVLLASRAGIQVQMVQYRGSAAVATAVMGGEITAGFDLIPGVIGQVRGGSVRPLAVTSSERSPELPDVPTIAEQGYGPYDLATWFGFVLKDGTPPAVIERLDGAVRDAVATPAVLERLRALGATPAYLGPEAFAAFLRAEPERWRPVVEASGVVRDL